MTDGAAPTMQVDKKQEAFRVAMEMYGQDPDWVTFFREVLGVDGVVRRLFPSAEEMDEFKAGREYAEIQRMVKTLREQIKKEDVEREPTRVITVRLPKSLHESLKSEAESRQISMNKLCISKLLQVVGAELIPVVREGE